MILLIVRYTLPGWWGEAACLMRDFFWRAVYSTVPGSIEKLKFRVRYCIVMYSGII